MATDRALLVCASASWCVPGYHTCALLDDKSVKCFGSNDQGRLGLGDTTHRTTPTAVTALGTSVVQIALGGAHARRAVCTCLLPRRRALFRRRRLLTRRSISALTLFALARRRNARSRGN